MKNKIIIISLVVLLIIGCAQEQVVQEQQKTEKEPAVITAIDSSDIEEDKDTREEPEDFIEDDVKELLTEGKDVKSIFYKYKGPETSANYYDFYVKGDKVKYIPDKEIKSLDEEDSYNAVYLDKAEKTAEAYCDDRQCRYKGKKADLDYAKYNILIPSEWADKITSAEKVGEEKIEKRSTWKIEANDGMTLWVDTFYGVPLQVMQNDNKYEFAQMAFNTLKDSDVVFS